jgi:hypothetical protein
MSSFNGPKLVGKSNYIEWLNEAKLYLEINGFMSYIDGTIARPNKNLYYEGNTPRSAELGVKYEERINEWTRNNIKSIGAIKSIITIDNIERFKDNNTASTLWQAIKETYGDSSFELIGRYLNQLIEANYSSFKNIDEYTSSIQSASIYLKELGYPMPKPFIAWIIFKGLPNTFDSLASRKYEEISDDIKEININKLISELISEEGRVNSNLEANKASYNKSNNKPYCKHCNKRGHLENKCYMKYPELKNSSNSNSKANIIDKHKNENNNRDNNKDLDNTLMITSANTSSINSISNYNTKNSIILDSGASEHFTPNKDWLLDYKPVNNKYITIANGTKLPLLGIGKIPILTSNNAEILVTEVNYVPAITTTLLSTKALTNKGWTIIIEDNIAKVVNYKKNITIVAKWSNNAYYLDLEVDNTKLVKLLYKADTSLDTLNIDLIYKRLNHINKDYLIKTINNTIDNTKLLEDNSSDFDYISKAINNSNIRKPYTITIDNNPNDTIRVNSPTRSNMDILENNTTKNDTTIEKDNNSSSSSSSNSSKDEDETDELNKEYYNSNENIIKSPYKAPITCSKSTLNYSSYNTNSIYNLASSAYLTSKIEGDSNNNTEKVIINKTKDTIILEPKSYKEATSLNNPYKDYWTKAMQKEINSLISNNTWDIITNNSTTDSIIKPIKTRWIYKLKENNNIIEFKARFVAKGFEQIYGQDYIDSFAAVIKQIAWKIVFAIAILNNYYIYKIDMISAFTEGVIDLIYIPTKDQKSNGLTKPLEKVKFKEFIKYLYNYK